MGSFVAAIRKIEGEMSLPQMKSSTAPSSGSIRVINPARNVLGSLRLPGDKSISHRYAMLAGFAEGLSHLTNFSSGADPHSTLACMEQLGAQVERGGPHAGSRSRAIGFGTSRSTSS